MTIAFFVSAFHPHVGGVEEFCRQLAHQLRARGVEVIVLTNRWPRSLPEVEIFEGIPVYSLPLRVNVGTWKSRLTALATGGLIRRRVRRILRRHRAEVLHVHCVSFNAVYALAARRQLGLPLVVTSHGELTMDSGGIFQRQRWAQDTLRDCLHAAGYVTAPSEQTFAELAAWYGQPLRLKGEAIPNGIALDAPSSAPWTHPRPYVLAIGRHVLQKGFDVLLRAVAELGQASPSPFDLLLAGDGAEQAALRALAEDLGLADRVRFVGRVEHSQALALFAGCLFFVLPSRHEPFGLVNLEAMAAGKAVIASRVGGVPEIVVDGETGLLVPAEDVSALAGALARLAGDPGLRDRLGAAGRRRAELFAWPVVVERYLAVYGRVLGRPVPLGPPLRTETA